MDLPGRVRSGSRRPDRPQFRTSAGSRHHAATLARGQRGSSLDRRCLRQLDEGLLRHRGGRPVRGREYPGHHRLRHGQGRHPRRKWTRAGDHDRFLRVAEPVDEGLLDYSAEAEILRLGYGSDADRYDDSLAGAASLRYGLTDDITIEGHAEGGSSLVNGGAGVVINVADKAVISLAVAASSSDEGRGAQCMPPSKPKASALPYAARRRARLATMPTRIPVRRAGGRGPFIPPLFTVASREVPRAVDQFSLGTPLPFHLHDGNRLWHIDEEDDPEVHLFSATYSRALLYDISLYTGAFYDFGEEADSGIYAGLSMPLGRLRLAVERMKHDKDGAGFSVSNARPLGEEPGSVGWYASIDSGEEGSAAAALSYRTDIAIGTVRARSYENGTAASGELSGAIAATADGIYFANRIDDGFAVVDAGAPNIPIMLENRRTAMTGSDGKALVTGLRAYEPNKISIDAVDLPLDQEITETEHIAVPRERAGVRVKFDSKYTGDAALAVLKFADGSYPPAGSRVVLEGSEAEYTARLRRTGLSRGLTGAHSLVVELDNGQCHAELTYAPSDDNFTTLDPVICK